MIYRAIGIMSGSSLDGLDIAFIEFTETGGKWSYEIIAAKCLPYQIEWSAKLANAVNLSAMNYLLLHAEYGHFIGNAINEFIQSNDLQHRVNLITSHGHTVFHLPNKKMTAQLGDGAAIAAQTNLPVVSDLRSLDVAFGGQGAPIVPIGEKLLFSQYAYLLNIGGIANISISKEGNYQAFDICAANSVLNFFAAKNGLLFDEGGKLAATGKIDIAVLNQLNNLAYYKRPSPKSLDNSYALHIVLPVLQQANLSVADALATYVEHVAQQINTAISSHQPSAINSKLLVTGGGALNSFLVQRLTALLLPQGVMVEVPDINLVQYKEALIMALMGVLRWREEINVFSSVTGATKNSIGGALWLGTDA